MRQGSFKGLSVVQREKKKHGGYQTKVVAGVIHRTPIQVCFVINLAPFFIYFLQESEVEPEEATTVTKSSHDAATPQRALGCPRVLKAGHATKCGAVVSYA